MTHLDSFHPGPGGHPTEEPPALAGASSVSRHPTPAQGTRLRRVWAVRAKRFLRSWATRSLAVGALATVIDLCLFLGSVDLLGFSTRAGAMLGVGVGATFAFFANRYFAFRDKNPALLAPVLRYVVATTVAMLVHGQLVVLLEGWLKPVVAQGWFSIEQVLAFSKMAADVLVFSVGQLLVLRFFVFPRQAFAQRLKRTSPPQATPKPSDSPLAPAPPR